MKGETIVLTIKVSAKKVIVPTGQLVIKLTVLSIANIAQKAIVFEE
jgi:hypothetical protein